MELGKILGLSDGVVLVLGVQLGLLLGKSVGDSDGTGVSTMGIFVGGSVRIPTTHTVGLSVTPIVGDAVWQVGEIVAAFLVGAGVSTIGKFAVGTNVGGAGVGLLVFGALVDLANVGDRVETVGASDGATVGCSHVGARVTGMIDDKGDDEIIKKCQIHVAAEENTITLSRIYWNSKDR